MVKMFKMKYKREKSNKIWLSNLLPKDSFLRRLPGLYIYDHTLQATNLCRFSPKQGPSSKFCN